MRTALKHLHFERWPAADRAAWNAMFREGDILNDAGTACHWAASTRHTNMMHYARWLGWCAGVDRLTDAAAPHDRVTPEALESYARSLLAAVAPRTVATMLIGLKCVVQRMAPDVDWSWLKALTNRLDSWAPSSRMICLPTMPAPTMFAHAIAELDRLSQEAVLTPRVVTAYRDTLIVGLLIACPIRLRNLTLMAVGKHLSREGGAWHLRFTSTETKTRQPLHLIVPDALTPFVDEYLARIRPPFPGADSHDRVWAAAKGEPMAYETIYNRVRVTTQRLFGAALNPHAFRTIAATLLAETSPEDTLHARSLLGHRKPTTTEQHYIRASQLDAARKVTAALQAIRDSKGV